ncbi:MAG: hypothetical protein VCD00_18260 [Candidatus Hydrogenedentota bacterium]
MKFRITRYYTLLVTCVFSAISFAQDEVDPKETPPAESLKFEVPAVDPLEKARGRGGDIIIMHSGAIMSGVQILKSTPTSYDIEVIPGRKPLTIPRRQVKRVEYDDIDPTREARHQANRPKPQDEIMTDGKELSPELVDALIKPIPEAPLTYTNQDYTLIFADITKKSGVTIVIDPSLKRQPPQARLWTVEIPAETKLMHVLQKLWLKKFVDGKISYELEMVILHQKDVVPTPVPKEGAPPTTPPALNLNLGNRN